MKPIEEIEYKGCAIKIFQDEDPGIGPRDWDNLGTMVCFHSRYMLGDKHDFTIEEIKEHVQKNDVLSLPLYLYDHLGITISTKPFSCPWDSGQVGFIIVDREKILKEYSVKRISPKLKEKVLNMLREEIEVYNMYLIGEVYGYMIEDQEGEDVDSCWGFYGYHTEQWDYMIKCTHEAVDHAEAKRISDLFKEYFGI